jgi:hypothetical protein
MKLIFESTESHRREKALMLEPYPPTFHLDTPSDDEEQCVEEKEEVAKSKQKVGTSTIKSQDAVMLVLIQHPQALPMLFINMR